MHGDTARTLQEAACNRQHEMTCMLYGAMMSMLKQLPGN
jgi:hypothetical protein